MTWIMDVLHSQANRFNLACLPVRGGPAILQIPPDPSNRQKWIKENLFGPNCCVHCSVLLWDGCISMIYLFRVSLIPTFPLKSFGQPTEGLTRFILTTALRGALSWEIVSRTFPSPNKPQWALWLRNQAQKAFPQSEPRIIRLPGFYIRVSQRLFPITPPYPGPTTGSPTTGSTGNDVITNYFQFGWAVIILQTWVRGSGQREQWLTLRKTLMSLPNCRMQQLCSAGQFIS